jgi:hypothetical protein
LKRIARYNPVTHRKGTTWRNALETLLLATAPLPPPFGESRLGFKNRSNPTITTGNMIAVSLARRAATYAATEAANHAIERRVVFRSSVLRDFLCDVSALARPSASRYLR